MIGPGLVMGGSAIGGGEWLTGPLVTARYGGALLWLATLSILGQVVYNLEISRYTLYCGEPIFTGKFRLLPGPMFWIFAYLLLDFGSIFPYLAANAATPLAAVMLGHIPDPKSAEPGLFGLTDAVLLRTPGRRCLPGLPGAADLRRQDLQLAQGGDDRSRSSSSWASCCSCRSVFSTRETWWEIISRLLQVRQCPGGPGDAGRLGPGRQHLPRPVRRDDRCPTINLAVLGLLCAMISISGNGGLTNTPISNYTRDQGWGMGHHVGAIPSVVGGHNLQLSHVGMVFQVNAESLPRWRRWYRHLVRDQLLMWMPACFFGLALPSMLSVQFLPRGTRADDWTAAGMTADSVSEHVGAAWGSDAGRNVLVHDAVLRLPGAGPQHGQHGRRRGAPLGRRLLDRPARSCRSWKPAPSAWSTSACCASTPRSGCAC